MPVTGGIGDDHPDGPDLIRDLVWGTALHGLTQPQEEPREHYLFERPEPLPLTGRDTKLDAVVRLEDIAHDCE